MKNITTPVFDCARIWVSMAAGRQRTHWLCRCFTIVTLPLLPVMVIGWLGGQCLVVLDQRATG